MTLSKYLSVLTLFFLTIILTASCRTNASKAKVKDAYEITSIRKDYFDSLPQPMGYVNDFENLFSGTEEQILDSLIGDFEKRTTIQIALITFDTTITTADSLEIMTLRIANAWGVGQKEKNNGVVIGISRAYRKMRIQNGYGIEKILTDAETKEIIDTAFIPDFRNENYFEGALNGLKDLMGILEKRYK
jgi:uncharacterized protein